MEQIKCYKGRHFTRYEDLPLSRRIIYWQEYLQRLVDFTMTQTEISPAKMDSLLSEIERVTQLMRILRTTELTATVPSKINITSNPKKNGTSNKNSTNTSSSVRHTSTSSNPDLRTSEQPSVVQRSHRAADKPRV